MPDEQKFEEFKEQVDRKIDSRFDAICTRFDKRTDDIIFHFDKSIETIRKEARDDRKEARDDRKEYAKSLRWTIGLGFTLFGVFFAALNIGIKFI